MTPDRTDTPRAAATRTQWQGLDESTAARSSGSDARRVPGRSVRVHRPGEPPAVPHASWARRSPWPAPPGATSAPPRRGRSSRTPRSPTRSPPASRCSSPPPPARRVRLRRARPQQRGPADQGRGQPRPPVEPRRRQSLSRSASILDLYDPDRSRGVTHRGIAGDLRTGASRPSAGNSTTRTASRRRPARLRILTETVTSPTLAAHDRRNCSPTSPRPKWVQYDPSAGTTSASGTEKAFGQPVNVVYDFTKADVVARRSTPTSSVPGPGHVRYSRDFATTPRRSASIVDDGGESGSAEPAVRRRVDADQHRRGRRPPAGAASRAIESFARALAAELGVAGAPAAGDLPDSCQGLDQAARRRPADARNEGKCVVVAATTSRRRSTPSPTPSTRSSATSAKTAGFARPADRGPPGRQGRSTSSSSPRRWTRSRSRRCLILSA